MQNERNKFYKIKKYIIKAMYSLENNNLYYAKRFINSIQDK